MAGEKGEPEGWEAHTGILLGNDRIWGGQERGDGEDRLDECSQALVPGLGAGVASRRRPRALDGAWELVGCP